MDTKKDEKMNYIVNCDSCDSTGFRKAPQCSLPVTCLPWSFISPVDASEKYTSHKCTACNGYGYTGVKDKREPGILGIKRMTQIRTTLPGDIMVIPTLMKDKKETIKTKSSDEYSLFILERIYHVPVRTYTGKDGHFVTREDVKNTTIVKDNFYGVKRELKTYDDNANFKRLINKDGNKDQFVILAPYKYGCHCTHLVIPKNDTELLDTEMIY